LTAILGLQFAGAVAPIRFLNTDLGIRAEKSRYDVAQNGAACV
jgi:hypothetical protein